MPLSEHKEGLNSPIVLLSEVGSRVCQVDSCAHLVSILRGLPAVQHIYQTSSLGIPESLQEPPDCIIIRTSQIEIAREAVQVFKGMSQSIPILGVLCLQDETPNLVQDVIGLMDLGMEDFLCCPFKPLNLLPRVQHLIPAIMKEEILKERKDQGKRNGMGSLVGESKGFRKVTDRVRLLASADATVLITGETGTGKELFALAIHNHSSRKNHPFIPVNCGALPENLVENELFGHARGAYTGAALGSKGLLGEAEGGTLFLDEINSLSLPAQVKLLRFLQNGEYRPVGSTKNLQANVRIVAASNADLRTEVQAKRFREDLYHRLNVLSLHVPPLRERPEDISLLAVHFLTRYSSQYARPGARFSPQAIQKLLAYSWPGNVRELESTVQRTAILASSSIVEPQDLDMPVPGEEPSNGSEPHHLRSFQEAKEHAINQFERNYLIELLSAYEGNISRASAAAGKDRRDIQRLMRKHNLDKTSLRK